MAPNTVTRLIVVAASVASLAAIGGALADRARGRTLSPDATEKGAEVVEPVRENELPKLVADAMHSHPRAIYVSGTKVTRGGDVEYRLTVRGTRKTELIARPDGTVISFK